MLREGSGSAARMKEGGHPEGNRGLMEQERQLSFEEKGQKLLSFKQRAINLATGILHSPLAAEEVVDNALVKAGAALDKFRHASTLFSWFTRIVINDSTDVLRQRKPLDLAQKSRTDESESELIEDLVYRLPDPARSVEQELVAGHKDVRQAFLQLSENERQALQLRIIDELTEEEAADILAIPLGTLKSRQHRGLVALRKKLLQIRSEAKRKNTTLKPPLEET